MGIVSEVIFKNTQSAYFACQDIEKKIREIEYTMQFFKSAFKDSQREDLQQLMAANQRLLDSFYEQLGNIDDTEFNDK